MEPMPITMQPVEITPANGASVRQITSEKCKKPTNGDPQRDVFATTQVADEDYGEDVAYFIGWGNEARVAGWDLKSLLDRRYYRADVAGGQGLLEGH